MSDGLQELANLINGCRDDAEGRRSKQSIVEAFLSRTNADAFDTVCALHGLRALSVNGMNLVQAIQWSRSSSAGTTTANDADHPGLYLASSLAASMPTT